MNALVSKFAKFLTPTTRCISSYGRPLFAEFKEVEATEFSGEADEPQRQSGGNEKCVNEVTLIGRVGKDPTLVTTANDRSFARFSFATNYLAGNEKHTDWHEILSLKEGLRDYVLRHIHKGDRLFLRGKLSYLRNQEAGSMRDQRARIILQDLVILKRRNTDRDMTSRDEF